MRVTMLWYGGSSYATPSAEDAEHFRSLKAAKRVFAARADHEPGFPCVEGSEASIYFGDEVTDYPDRLLTLGKRGGIRVERT